MVPIHYNRPATIFSATFLCSSPISQRSSQKLYHSHGSISIAINRSFFFIKTKENGRDRRGGGIVCSAGGLLPVDPWAPTVDSQSIASQLFAASLLPYIGFLYFITKSKSAPKLTLFGFYFLLAFVGATIPAGIYAKVHYGTSLSNVDWLHGGAESLLTLTNLFIVLGLRQALRKPEDAELGDEATRIQEQEKSSV